MTIYDILKDSAYKTEQFSQASIDSLNSRIIEKIDKKGRLYAVVECLVRKKQITLKPEEVVRQLLIDKLINGYGYPVSRIQLEYPVYFGREVKRADIVIMDEDRPIVPYIIIEVKKPKLKEGKEQLKSYCNSTGAPIAVWCNGEQIVYYNRKDPNYFEDIRDIPKATQTLMDVISERWTIEDLKRNDLLQKDKISLKDKIKDLEDEVLANAGVDVFEECFKLIFAKLYDEFMSGQTPSRYLEFTNAGRTEFKLKEAIQDLFNDANKKWKGVFDENTKIMLSPSHLSICVASLQSVKLFNSNLEVVDDAFEYLMSKSSKGEKGQFFTPRYVIEMCVRMLNPHKNEKMIDTACGSSGFPVHTIFNVWDKMADAEGRPKGELFSLDQKPAAYTDYVKENIFGIDFDEKAVRVARTLNLIAGDGHTNMLHLNTLDYDRWDETAKQKDWLRTYSEGFWRLEDLRRDKKSYREFNFDIVMANPPFAGDIKETRILGRYELGKNDKGKTQSKVGRDVLFIERNLDFLKPGGRMAIVLPQGRFNNSSDKYIREYIAQRCRILAVVGLHGNTFKPHTGTKTSVLFVQKWGGEYKDEITGETKILCPRKDDYNIFFATQQKRGKDNSGDKIYIKQADGTNALDAHGHLVVEQDLYNHDGITGDGIAEAFAEFAKKEGLSFFQ
ncbi:MAG: N-6 DNA methylase [Clostridiales bacterium]|nr:N-6 DNA methylase [Clostridiales bacterium]